MSSLPEASREQTLKETTDAPVGAPASVSPHPEAPAPAPGTANGKVPFWRRWSVVIMGTLLLFGLLYLGLGYLIESFASESTDDAFIDTHFVSVAPRVAGQVRSVPVDDNQPVKAGDLLVEIDARDFAAKLDQKRAALNAARANVDLLKADVDLALAQKVSAEAVAKQSQAEAEAAQSAAVLAKADFQRAQDLIGSHTISPQEYDRAQQATTAAENNLHAAQQKILSDQSKIAQAGARIEASRRAVERAEAQSRQAEAEEQTAELDLSYVRITAPIDGRVTKKAVEAGDYAQIGQNLLALVPSQVWVTANFKEDELRRIRTNQPVKIYIDSVAGGPFPGRVQSIQAGSGARFSLLPPENAVGNFVKVVQRVPVKIVFDDPTQFPAGEVIGPGLSVEPRVRVSDFEISKPVIAVIAALIALILGAVWFRAAHREKP